MSVLVSEEVLTSMAGLNAWARSISWAGPCYKLLDAIYVYKYKIIGELTGQGLVSARYVFGVDRGLRWEFVECTLPNNLVWHVPADPLRCPAIIWEQIKDTKPEEEKTWSINRPGLKLSALELVSRLNVVETWDKSPQVCMWQDYHLPIGKQSVCAFCGEQGRLFLGRNSFFLWAAMVCDGCYKTVKRFEIPFPVELWNDQIAEWLDRKQSVYAALGLRKGNRHGTELGRLYDSGIGGSDRFPA